MPGFLFFLFIILIVTILGAGVITYIVVRGTVKLAQSFRISPLPRSVARSLKESRRYGRAITQVARQYPPGPMRDRLNLTMRLQGADSKTIIAAIRELEEIDVIHVWESPEPGETSS